jgi:hypothetical protein
VPLFFLKKITETIDSAFYYLPQTPSTTTTIENSLDIPDAEPKIQPKPSGKLGESNG